jgi:hypothetical protein
MTTLNSLFKPTHFYKVRLKLRLNLLGEGMKLIVFILFIITSLPLMAEVESVPANPANAQETSELITSIAKSLGADVSPDRITCTKVITVHTKESGAAIAGICSVNGAISLKCLNVLTRTTGSSGLLKSVESASEQDLRKIIQWKCSNG